MARAVAQYVFAALLALLSAQAAVPSRHLESPARIVWCAETEQQATEQVRRGRTGQAASPAVAEYTSHISAPPDAAVLFQRPPPAISLFV
jgi:hypothetical protein